MSFMDVEVSIEPFPACDEWLTRSGDWKVDDIIVIVGAMVGDFVVGLVVAIVVVAEKWPWRI